MHIIMLDSAETSLRLTLKDTILNFKHMANNILNRRMRYVFWPDMIPAMILVMPVSWLWSGWLLPLLS